MSWFFLGFPIVETWGEPSILQFFEPPLPPTKIDAPHGQPPPPHTHTLKNEATHLKNKLQLKHETKFHEMIPRKSTINNNFKSS